MKPSNAMLREKIRSVPDFPKKGIVFRDITTLLKDPEGLRGAADGLYARYREERIDVVAGVESRGFIVGGILAEKLGVGFVPIRKPGKLPAPTARMEYALEYGTDALEIHRDGIQRGQRVLLHDDLLATGGTAKAACALIEELGGTIGSVAFLIELQFLHGRDALRGYDVYSLVQYATEQ